MNTFLVLCVALLAAFVAGDAVTLTNSNFKAQVHDSGKNSFIKFYAPWCGHCKAMKPAWDQLGSDFFGSSVLIGDVDCIAETELCSQFGVSGYPTVKYFTPETGEKGADYQGGRDIETLKKFVQEKLETKCSVADITSCDEKEQAFYNTWHLKSQGEINAQLARLQPMQASKMAAELKAWVNKRVNILKQLQA
eukprot:gnl/Spiro4/25670_TR12789_c0_g1_i1.p2 gnl/Spiro4/25670_TR12789_c0_g1~~gnl/Spiro4/25670_TR12789_c0_g1_i1.p2  ORF type:complete len:193 (+),score=62.84 gnl/Spiro4/25670_TR12789_c0_g1_i1:67-645(+)